MLGVCTLTAFSKRLTSVVLYDPRSAVSLSLHSLDSRVVPVLFKVHSCWRHCRIAATSNARYGTRYDDALNARATYGFDESRRTRRCTSDTHCRALFKIPVVPSTAGPMYACGSSDAGDTGDAVCMIPSTPLTASSNAPS